jgi:hypothetical protein
MKYLQMSVLECVLARMVGVANLVAVLENILDDGEVALLSSAGECQGALSPVRAFVGDHGCHR